MIPPATNLPSAPTGVWPLKKMSPGTFVAWAVETFSPKVRLNPWKQHGILTKNMGEGWVLRCVDFLHGGHGGRRRRCGSLSSMYFAVHVSMRDMITRHMKRLFQLAGAMTVSLLFLSIPENVELVRILYTYHRNQSFLAHLFHRRCRTKTRLLIARVSALGAMRLVSDILHRDLTSFLTC